MDPRSGQMPSFRLGHGGRYTVTGAPVVLSDLSSTMTGSIALILLVALGVMALTLFLVFRSPLRLLPLTIALMAAGITFGAIVLVGGSLTLGSLAVLPILIGLAVDYAIQFQSRVQEARRDQPTSATAETLATAARVGAPAIAAAALATATGFLVLLLSPVPLMARSACCSLSGSRSRSSAPWSLHRRARTRRSRRRIRRRVAERGRRDARRTRASRDLGAQAPEGPGRAGAGDPFAPSQKRRASVGEPHGDATRGPGLVLGSAWIGGPRLGGRHADRVQSDVTKLVPSSMPALRDLHTLERTSGVSGEIDVTVRGRDVTRPAMVSWMTRYEQACSAISATPRPRAVRTPPCARLSRFPTCSPPREHERDSAQRGFDRQPLGSGPAYFKQAVITRDRREATLAFGIRLMPLARQQRVIDYMSSQLHPPRGSERAAGGHSGAGRAGRRGALLLGASLAHPARGPRRGRTGAACGLPASGASAATARPDRPGHRLVGADPVPDQDPAQSDVGQPWDARDRDLHRVQRPSVRALPPGAGRRLPARGGLTADLPFDGGAVLASGITAIAGFGVLVVSTFRCCATSGS